MFVASKSAPIILENLVMFHELQATATLLSLTTYTRIFMDKGGGGKLCP